MKHSIIQIIMALVVIAGTGFTFDVRAYTTEQVMDRCEAEPGGWREVACKEYLW